MEYFHGNTRTAVANTNFRAVVYTGRHTQVVLMSVSAGEEIGEEVHEEHDQTFVIVAGEGKMTMGAEKIAVHPGDVVVVPAGVYHNMKSLGPEDLKLYSFCTPPHHRPDVINVTRQSAAPEQEH